MDSSTARVILLGVAVCACGGEPPRPTALPLPPGSGRAAFAIEVDPDIARITDEPPPGGRLPKSLAWSPDGTALAFLRSVPRQGGSMRAELWLHEVKGHRERPLVASDDLAVDEFVWAGASRLAFVAGGDVRVVALDGSLSPLTSSPAAEHGVAASPDGSRVAFVRDHDVYVFDFASGRETRVTDGGSERRRRGEVTWIYGEEFDVVAGMGWSPDGKRLWFYATDESRVPEVAVMADADGNTIRQAYPRPGDPNPVVRVGVADVSGKGTARITWLDTGSDDDVYLPQVTWLPDSSRLAVARLDRLQTILELLVCDAVSGGCAVSVSERDPRWVNLPPPPRFLGRGDEFLWISEADGFAHVRRHGIDGSLRGRITRGQWTVASIDAVDEKRGAIWITANADRPTSWGIYRVKLDGGDPERVTPEGGSHEALFSPDLSLFVDTHSAIDRPARVDLRDSSGPVAATIAEGDLVPYSPPAVANDIFPIEATDGETLWALLTRPAALDPTRRYPVLVYVYGGPRAQVVKDAFRPKLQPWRNWVASRGILVFSLDGRGSGGRGRTFETAVHLRLGERELEDQLAGVAYLKTQPYADPGRVAVFGWSYGGTMALAALLRAPEAFRCGVAVAPVTDWRQYDSAYTERYMQRPSENAEGYEATSLLGLAGRLERPLLLVHGLADDNVHFANTALLVDALIRAGRGFDLMVYPGKSHSIDGPEARADLFTRITRFLEAHL